MTEIDTIFKELEDLKEQIQEARQEKAEKTGQLSEQMKALKSFGVATIPEAKKQLLVLQKEIKSLEGKITVGFDTLKENYEW